MIRLLFVGDGERDAAMNPPLVQTIAGFPILPSFRPWPRLHGTGRGYDRKLLFALGKARREDLQGIVATVDRDKSPHSERLGSMKAARERDRATRPPLPTALGCADPHAEAWLLDDPQAVRKTLKLPVTVAIRSVLKIKDPKRELGKLQAKSPRDEAPKAIMAEIAAALDPGRCKHGKRTGFESFVAEVRGEIAPLGTST